MQNYNRFENNAKVENSIIKKFRRDIWSKFTRAVREYELIQQGDKIAVCMSGGKDSMLLAKCMQELAKYSPVKFDLKFLVMDPGYNALNRQTIEYNAEFLHVPVTIFESQIFDTVASVEGGSPCYLCARMRRGYLYSKAKELGCNKIALGHHFDDVIETILLSMLYGGELKTMMPKLHSDNFEGMELIRPLYLVKEESIIAWRNYNELKFIDCACRFTENRPPEEGGGTKRTEMKALIRMFRQTNPHIEHNIFRSVENVHINAIVGYREKGVKHNFLERYKNNREHHS